MTGERWLGAMASIFRREGEFWTLGYRDDVCRLRDSKGLRYLALLLTRRGDRVAAADLVATGGHLPHEPDEAPGGDLDAERARVNVTRAISSALRRISAHHPALAAHLGATVRTGRFCTYRPDPHTAIDWDL